MFLRMQQEENLNKDYLIKYGQIRTEPANLEHSFSVYRACYITHMQKTAITKHYAVFSQLESKLGAFSFYSHSFGLKTTNVKMVGCGHSRL